MTTEQIIHPTAKIRAGAMLQGSIIIGANTFVAAGAVIAANGGTIEIGSNTVIMENAVIRSSAKFNCKIGNNVLIGPKAGITGATIADCCFVATNGTVFQGSVLSTGTVLAVNGIIQIDSYCPANTFIPINHIAFGKPARIYSPLEMNDFHDDLGKTGFTKYVYGIDTTGLSNAEVYRQLTEKFLRSVPG